MEEYSLGVINGSNYTNETWGSISEIPPPPDFTNNVLIQVIVYCILFLVAATGNLTVLITLIRGRHRKSRISLMIMHLTIADLVVTFIMIPLEVAWRITVQWLAGNAACKILTLLRAFGLYLSSNVLVCVSLDRYFAILHPLRTSDARRRGKFMLALAWIFSFLCAFPQSIVFHVAQHPSYPNFYQCVTFQVFSSETLEISYQLFSVSFLYFIPLIVILFAYSCILLEVSTQSRETQEDNNREIQGRDTSSRGRMRLRRSDMSNIARARSRTLRMTITIVAAFIWCWTPYVVMSLWYVFDRVSAKKVDQTLQDALFMMAVSNSCVNPIVYGSYAMNLCKDCLCLKNKYTSHNNLARRSTCANGLPFSVLHPKQENAFLRVRPLFPHQEVRSTATTRTATFQTPRRGRFTFSSSDHLESAKTIGPHSDVYIQADNDSGVSISYRGRPYHSEPAQEGVSFEMEYLRATAADSVDGLCSNHDFGHLTPNSSTGNRKMCSYVTNMTFLKDK